jgi:hypothetical protein
MKQKFNVILLGDVWDFLDSLDDKSMKQYFKEKQKNDGHGK